MKVLALLGPTLWGHRRDQPIQIWNVLESAIGTPIKENPNSSVGINLILVRKRRITVTDNWKCPLHSV